MSVAQQAFLKALWVYRTLATPVKVVLGLQGCCRFTPTCSKYAEIAVCQHGVGRGLWLTGGRLLRCHPFGPSGLDPVPSPKPRIEALSAR